MTPAMWEGVRALLPLALVIAALVLVAFALDQAFTKADDFQERNR